MAYKHGAYGEITASRVTVAKQSDVVAAYIGTAPVHLIRSYSNKNLINMPIKVANMSDAQRMLGYSPNWGEYTLCEAFAEHFDNTVGNVGPIYVVNVFDPDVYKFDTPTTKVLSFTNNRAEFESTSIILDTFAIDNMVEGVDYTLEYNFAKSSVIVKLLKGLSITCTVTNPKGIANQNVATWYGKFTSNGETFYGIYAENDQNLYYLTDPTGTQNKHVWYEDGGGTGWDNEAYQTLAFNSETDYGELMANLWTFVTREEGGIKCSYHETYALNIKESDIVGQTTEDGQYTGLHALKLLYQNHNAVLNMLAAPGWSHIPSIYKAMVSMVQKLNGHWDGFVNADIPLVDADGKAIDTIAKAIAWKEANGYNSEYSKVYWPKVKDGNGREFHLATKGQATMLRVDLSHDGVPFESPSNKEIMATKQYFGAVSKNNGFDQHTGNSLNEKGITTACFWGGQWVLWGPHTAAYSYNGNMDARAIFDVNIRMLMYITNSFQLDHGTAIDSPMTPQDKEAILNVERQKLDTLTGIGALIGTPSVEFLETENPESDMMNGDFVWNFSVTNTPPFKSGTARVCYTDEGFAAFFETE